MTPTAERLRRLRDLFDGAIELAPEQRASYLRRAADDPSLIGEVEALIAESDRTERDLSTLVDLLAVIDNRPTIATGQRLGAYDVVRLVGRGGMGAVYEAARADDQYHKRVAIKVVEAGAESDVTIARFRRERQILASLEHPNIATLVDGGIMADGRPFLVMEYVDGEPITTWCDARSLSVRARVELFRQVCNAVRHAHRSLVVHRDLKPGNILVTADGAVKLLDFGIATLISTDRADDSLPLTRGAFRAFTPEYASPEQIRGDLLTTATDVYSLGVVLYELLAGTRPPRRNGTSFDHRVIAPPQRPSSVASGDAARARGERDATQLARRLRGDLDSIVLKALREETQRRYASVEALDDDLARYLSGRAVGAQRDRASYRIGKFVRRNRAAVVASAAALLALFGGALISLKEARSARLEADRATLVANFLQSILGSRAASFAATSRLPQANLSLRDVLDNAAQRLPAELDRDPLVRADLHRVIGAAYHAAMDPLAARAQFDSALSIHLRELGPDNIEVARDLVSLGFTTSMTRPDSAEPIVKRGLALYQRRNAPDTLAEYQLGLMMLAETVLSRGDTSGADTLIHRVIGSEQHRTKPRLEVLGFATAQMGINLRNRGMLDSAEATLRRGIALYDSSRIGPSYEETVHLYYFGTLLATRGKYAEAATVLTRAKQMAASAVPPGHTMHVQVRMALADALSAVGDTATAHDEARAGLAMIPSLPKGTEVFRFLAEWRYAFMLRRERRFVEAEDAARRANATAQVGTSAFPQYRVDAGWLLGAVLVDRQEYAAAESALQNAYRIAHDTLGPTNARTKTVERELARLYLRWGKDSQASQFLVRLPAAEADSLRRSVAAELGARPPAR